MQTSQNLQIMRLSAPDTDKQMGVTVYDGQNYFEWSSGLQVVLYAADLWRVIQTGIPTSCETPEMLGESSTETKTRMEKFEKIMTKNDKALGKILQSIDRRFQTKILEQSLSAKDAWEYLKKDSLSQATVRSRALNTQFTGLKYTGDQEMSVYLSVVSGLVSELSRLGVQLTEAQVIEQIVVSIQGCRGSEAVIAQIDDMDSEKKTFESISTKLLLWHSRSKALEAQEMSIDEVVQGKVLALWNKVKGSQNKGRAF